MDLNTNLVVLLIETLLFAGLCFSLYRKYYRSIHKKKNQLKFRLKCLSPYSIILGLLCILFLIIIILQEYVTYLNIMLFIFVCLAMPINYLLNFYVYFFNDSVLFKNTLIMYKDIKRFEILPGKNATKSILSLTTNNGSTVKTMISEKAGRDIKPKLNNLLRK
ncbi:hypothetical protein [Clostridium vincentii]|uniref:Uncharacterized protein n=1 Tax=Clostridium vincentii TaxID=52704 RepID=A0A2T0BJM6_9CLOT|nr:hypothetical protein [Clostridium vincentii]PRR84098.1 hypothetical protein CLVI_03960 [Clostridium vincentii]